MGLNMEYTCPIKLKEGIDMETTFYTFTANEIIVTGAGVQQVSGDNARRMVYLRHSEPAAEQPAGGKVIDFNAWCAAHEQDDCGNEEEAAFYEEEATVCAETAARSSVWSMIRKMDLDQALSVALIAVSVFACVGILF